MLTRVPDELAAVFAAIREELEVPAAFPDDVLAAAEQAVRDVALPEEDLTALEFFTIDPPGSMDLDQAMFLERDGDGHRVRYAIADVPAFVALGDPIDAEARRRGTTIYAPDARTPLHPPVISEGAASLLPGEIRPAFVWDLRLDGGGEVTSATVGRARVRSTARLAYTDPVAPLLAEIGVRRIALERARGGAELAMPEQEVEAAAGGYALRFRPQVDTEDHNAQISLMTGMAAAKLMLDGGVGVLRTMPPPEERALRRLRRQAHALGIAWPDGQPHGEFLHSLDRTQPAHLALVHASRSLFRGAGYTVLPADGDIAHASIAAPYAHVTAPLRRLVDRFALLVCAALCAGEDVPPDVRAALAELPELMRAADRRAGSVERACTDAVEAAVLAPRVGEEFDAVAVDEDAVQLREPAVVAPVAGKLQPGAEVRVKLVEADVRRRLVRFAPAH